MSDHLRYLGQNCGLLQSFPFMQPDSPPEVVSRQEFHSVQEKIESEAKNATGLQLIAITADYWQYRSHDLLLRLGFKKQFTFFSAHHYRIPSITRNTETLTVWTRKNTTAPNGNGRTVESAGYNCSCDINHRLSANSRRLVIRTNLTDSDKPLFKKFEDVDIWYQIDPVWIIDTQTVEKIHKRSFE